MKPRKMIHHLRRAYVDGTSQDPNYPPPVGMADPIGRIMRYLPNVLLAAAAQREPSALVFAEFATVTRMPRREKLPPDLSEKAQAVIRWFRRQGVGYALVGRRIRVGPSQMASLQLIAHGWRVREHSKRQKMDA